MLKRIILHWTAGYYFPNSVDLKHYHYLICKDGEVLLGKFPPEANIICKNGQYSAHTKNGNTGSIGVALCGMLGYKNPTNLGNYPIVRKQAEKCFFLCANLCKKYSFSPVKNNITTHYHFNKKHSIKTGKIDIEFLPPFPNIKSADLEDFIVDKVQWYFKQIS